MWLGKITDYHPHQLNYTPRNFILGKRLRKDISLKGDMVFVKNPYTDEESFIGLFALMKDGVHVLLNESLKELYNDTICYMSFIFHLKLQGVYYFYYVDKFGNLSLEFFQYNGDEKPSIFLWNDVWEINV